MITSELQDYVDPGSELSVLVVDDSAAVRAAIRQVLELVSLRVLESANGKDALTIVYEEKPDLIVLDVEMPGMCGMSVLNTIRNSWGKLELPVVMITPNDSSVEVVRALDIGANDFISRPLDFDILWARISNQLMQKQAAQYMSAAKDQLEQQVRQRTAELDSINKKLTEEVKERSMAQAKLKKQANYDHLTGLPNRHLAMDRLSQVICKAQRQKLQPCVAYIDLDNFKHVNDTLGHAAGDELLRQAAGRLTSCARKSDSVARLGGDEFLLIIDDDGNEPEHMREHAISTVGDRLLHSFNAPFIIDDNEIDVSPSIGFALYGKDGEDCDNLMRNADVAMYRSKKDGKNAYCFFSPDMMAKSRVRQFVESNLSRAIGDGLIELLFEPILDLDQSRIGVVEVSLSWNNDDMGVIDQQVFMPVAEDCELIVPLTEWMISASCEQLRNWKRLGFSDTRIAMNIAQKQLDELDLVAVFHREIRKHELDSNEFMLLLHEAVIEKESNRALIEKLIAAGLRIVLTGFGDSGSSLSSVHMYELEAVRTVDACINDLDVDGACRGMLKTVSALTSAMDMDLIVTGLTTESEIEDLADMGCAMVQGEILSAPLASASFIEVLRSWNGIRLAKPAYLELVKTRSD